MRTIAVLRNDLQSLNRLLVAHDIIQHIWPIFLYPRRKYKQKLGLDRISTSPW